MTEHTLREIFRGLADEEVIARIARGLTEEAHAIACAELKARGIEPPAAEPAKAPDEASYLGDMVLLARDLGPTEAHILATCLASAGIRAEAGDANTVQANGLWAIALGGAKVRVPESQLEEARHVLNAFRRGEFALGEDFDVGDKVE